MVELWFYILCLMLTIFVLLDGWDFGAGALHLVVARNDAERRQVFAAIGPLWSWNEVWLVGSGGVLAMAFPRMMALALSGFYLAIVLLLWCLLLRGIAVEVRGHIDEDLWRDFWDFVFAISNVLIVVLLGVALGNVIRGVPLDSSGEFFLPLFTNFGTHGQVGLLDWYTFSIGLFSLVALCAHGATYLTFKTKSGVHDSSLCWSRRLWVIFFILLPFISWSTWAVRKEFSLQLAAYPLGLFGVLGFLLSATFLIEGIRSRRESLAFYSSCGILVSMLTGLSAMLYPTVLQSTLSPAYSLTAHQGAADDYGLLVGIRWWPVAFILALVYLVFIARNYRGKAEATKDTQGFY